MTPVEQLHRYQRAYAVLRAEAVRRMLLLWDRAGGVSDEDADRFVSAAVPQITGIELAVANLAVANIAILARLATGTGREASVPADEVSGEALRGVDPAEVYLRPIIAVRTALAGGKPLAEALGLGRQRAAVLAETDVILAQRAATRSAIERDKRIVGYRRVLTGKSCVFCATASTQRYRRGDLMPIHPRCDCSTAPIFGSADPGRVINQSTLDNLKARGPKYWAERGFVGADGSPIEPGSAGAPVTTRTHGELGPVLVDRHDHFDGPGVAA